MYFRKTNKKRSERGGSPTGKEGYTKIRPEEWESLRADIRGVCFKIKNCIWDTTYDQPLNKPPKMERKIGL